MKRTFLLKTMLLLFALIVGVGSAWADGYIWMKTTPANLAAGDVVVIVDVNTSKAMNNDPASGKAPGATDVTLNADKDQIDVTEKAVADNLLWTLEAADGNKCCFKVGGNYLYVTSADDGLRVGAATGDGEVKAFGLASVENSGNEFLAVEMSGSENRYVGYNSSYKSKGWKTKTSIDDDISNTVIAFFKRYNKSTTSANLVWTGSGLVDGNFQVDKNSTDPITYPTLTKPSDLTGTITYSSSNEWVATVNASTGEVTALKKRGTVTITASFAGDDTYDPATVSYTLRVDDSSSEEGSQAHPFTPSTAISYAKGGNATDGWTYFVRGRVSKIESSAAAGIASFIPGMSNESSTDGTLTYYISDDGTTGTATKELKISCGRKQNLDNLTENDITVGDNVLVAGPLFYGSDTPDIASLLGGGGGTGTGTGSSSEKTVKMDATNYIHEHTTVLSTVDLNIYRGQTKTAAQLYTLATANSNGTPGAVTIESDKTDIFYYDTDNVVWRAAKEGEATVTVTVPVSDVTLMPENNGTKGSYTMVSKFKVTVKSRDVEAEGTGSYQLVTAASTLQADDKLLIVATKSSTNYALGNTQGDTNRSGIKGVTIESDAISDVPSDAQIVTLEKEGDNWMFNVGSDAYLYASSADADELKTDTKTNAGDNAKATIAIDETSKEATITFVGANTHNTLKLKSSYSTYTFACYQSSDTKNTLPKLYRYVQADSYTITTGATGYKTLVSSLDVDVLPEGLKAYIVTAVGTDNVTTTEVTAIEAGKPYILKGANSTSYELTKATTKVTAPTTNKLEVSVAETGNGVYVLATHGGVTGFYKWNGGRLGSGRVYLPESASAPEFLAIDENATGIRSIDNEQLIMDNDIYDLSGRRVEHPTKGLYIVNGKKVIIK